MTKTYHIEELRDTLPLLKKDAEFLYRYGTPPNSIELFEKLSPDDRRVLVYLALSEGDSDVQKVAQFLIKKLQPIPQGARELLLQISARRRAELKGFADIGTPEPAALTWTDCNTITQELRKACERIGFLDVEEAFWILIPHSPADDSSWIEAIGGMGQETFVVIDPFRVRYDPRKEEKYDLIASMRSAAWILHVHNHPQVSGYISLCEPSDNDLGFAEQWKSVRGDLGSRMKFFVIQGNTVVEYALPEGKTEEWSV